MSGFISVPSSRVGSIVARPLACGWVWAFRPLPAGGRSAGFSPAPACLFIPFDSQAAARSFALGVANAGFRAFVRYGSAGSPVFSACGLPVPDFAVKVVLPVGVSTATARQILSTVPAFGSLAFAL